MYIYIYPTLSVIFISVHQRPPEIHPYSKKFGFITCCRRGDCTLWQNVAVSEVWRGVLVTGVRLGLGDLGLY